MSRLLLFNKPFDVVCQFRPVTGQRTLADFIAIPGVYPAGRLDKDSEGLVLLTDDGKLQARIAHPRYKLVKTYLVQVEGDISANAMERLTAGVQLSDGPTRPAGVRKIPEPVLPERDPPVRFRESIPSSWIEIKISEGRNRQVRRMTAAVGYPTLRLYRISIGDWSVEHLAPGEFTVRNVHLPTAR